MQRLTLGPALLSLTPMLATSEHIEAQYISNGYNKQKY